MVNHLGNENNDATNDATNNATNNATNDDIDYKAKYLKLKLARKQTQEKWRLSHMDTFTKCVKRYYDKKKHDPVFREKQNKRSTDRYYAKKQAKLDEANQINQINQQTI